MNRVDTTIIGVIIGVVVGISIAIGVFYLIRYYKKSSSLERRVSNTSAAPIRENGEYVASVDSSVAISDDLEIGDYHQSRNRNLNQLWGGRGKRGRDVRDPISVSGIPRYYYKDIQKATQNFTTILGQGSFGPVYKAVMLTGEVVAVKVLASDSRQGEREFQTEVALLSRLHHRNLVNLVGYCVDKGQRILIYEYMSNGSLASHLYSESNEKILSWEQRLQIAHDVSHGIEYLHEGAVPPVIHRDLKSANILLDRSMRAKVADFGLSKEEVFDGRKSGLKGTFGYMDPDYMSTNKFTKKSDIYSFGIILFELITAINPQQGLLDYINLASLGGDGKPNWSEIIDKNLLGESHPEEVRQLADVAHRCLHKLPKRRPPISDVTQAIARIRQRKLRKDASTFTRTDTSGVLRAIELQQVELSNIASMKEMHGTAVGA
ncbi:Protein kinase superfamily protein [Rhynchospora pubera]|uniref:non-specific serine/threonine protein kinase n=1 Tax=Rhynchospora pubera TaxID=906938 RepID=A0AAV8D8U9_9POAL|nr:Protein kinase superfamily protein [Rhynchospora pubera]